MMCFKLNIYFFTLQIFFLYVSYVHFHYPNISYCSCFPLFRFRFPRLSIFKLGLCVLFILMRSENGFMNDYYQIKFINLPN
ncbi:hypothetical protein C1645_765094, partial [Glomus cerebriforme]